MAVRTGKLQKVMDQATNYEQWKEAALAYDRAVGNDRWRLKDQSTQYDNTSIRIRLDRLRSLRARHAHRSLLFTLNEGIHGNMAGMGKSELYAKAMFGTKQLIVDYVDEIVDTLHLLASPEVDEISFEEKLDFFRRAHHCFGRSALMMSGSGMLLFFHVGVIKALTEEGLLPNIMSGSSGGAVVGSLVCTHTDAELRDFFDPEHLAAEIEMEADLFQSRTGLRPRPLRWEDAQELIARLIPDMTFEESFKHTGRMLNVSIAPAETHQTSRLLNATTSPNVLIRQAALASAAVPGIYPPVTLQARDSWGERQDYLPSRKWVDGSMSDDLPAKRLARLYGVNHYIVSQTNPHVIPFVSDSKRQRGTMAILKNASRKTIREWINASVAIMERPLRKSPTLNQATNMMLSIINQDYIGDVNILPQTRLNNPFTLLAHPTPEYIMNRIADGERSTWRKIEMIRIQTRISTALEEILQDYEEQFLQRGKQLGNVA
mgnify:CR=1 FL=1